jgi:hypothetical protein
MLISTAKIPAITAASFVAAAALTTLAATSTAALAKKGIQPKPIAHECFWRPRATAYVGGKDEFAGVKVDSVPKPQNIFELVQRTVVQAQINIDATIKGLSGDKVEPVDLDTVTTVVKIESGYCPSAELTEILVGYTHELSSEHLEYLRNKIMIDINAGALPSGLPLVLSDHGKRRVAIPQMGMTEIDKVAFSALTKFNGEAFFKENTGKGKKSAEIRNPSQVNFSWTPILPNMPDAFGLGNNPLTACPANPGRPARYVGDPNNQKFSAGLLTCTAAQRLARLAQ